MGFRPQDIDQMLAGPMGTDVTLLGATPVTVRGFIDIADEPYAPNDGAMGGLVGTVRIRIRTGSMGAGLVSGVTVQTAGVSYRVQQIEQEGDGEEQVLFVAPN